jgi:hypothetical protein
MAREYLRLQFTFTTESDVKAYGAGPHLYDEYQIVALPARTLVELETATGITAAAMLNGVRISSAMGDLAATWVALKLAGGDGLPDFADYNPAVMTIEWAAAPAVEPGKDEGPATMSAESDVVTLQTLPRVE